ncbi:glycosyltransferase family 4 protein [Brevundimonas sp.]|uniref:glycosyltransferase family 4 protein n=2 Tax=Bacteria TaxID=2 RepID=UPI003AFFD5F8
MPPKPPTSAPASSICVDGFNLAASQGTGIATYSRNLLEAASRMGFRTEALFGPAIPTASVRPFGEVAILDPARPAGPLRLMQKLERDVRTRLTPLGRTAHPVAISEDVIWPGGPAARPSADGFWASDQLYFYANRCFKKHRHGTPIRFDTTEAAAPAVMHWTTLLPLHAKNVPNIYTIHDLIPLRLPHTTLHNKAVFLDLCREVVRRADHIAVVSEATRQDVIRMLGVPEDRVTNTYQAVSLPKALVARPEAEVATELEATFQLGWGDYFLHFGAVEPKKNLGRVVEAYMASGVKTPLVVVGGRGWLGEAETALLSHVKAIGGPSSDRIHVYEYMSFATLVSLIRGARAVLFPSLYEGFGLPVLEAMSLGTPVLTSDQGSLPEVAGEAALQVDPYNIDALSQAIRMIDADTDWRIAASTRGRRQAALFNDYAYDARLRALYAKVGVPA